MEKALTDTVPIWAAGVLQRVRLVNCGAYVLENGRRHEAQYEKRY